MNVCSFSPILLFFKKENQIWLYLIFNIIIIIMLSNHPILFSIDDLWRYLQNIFWYHFVSMPELFMSVIANHHNIYICFIVTIFMFYFLCHKQTPMIILILQERTCEYETQNFLSTFICMWPSTLLMHNINARGNDSQKH